MVGRGATVATLRPPQYHPQQNTRTALAAEYVPRGVRAREEGGLTRQDEVPVGLSSPLDGEEGGREPWGSLGGSWGKLWGEELG